MEALTATTDPEISVELRYLVYLCLWMLVLWVPYILAHIVRVGLVSALSYTDGEMEMPVWAQRLKKAHYNLVENIVPFAVAVGIGELFHVHTVTTAECALVFLVARLLHPFAQVFAIWGTRTIVFAAGLGAVLVYLLTLMRWI